ncbi:uncharacterized protein LOC142326691 isoform X1 [Lycorma delicatula]|uniref:uncharacterized protein LOC142326691 isoform X1 n=1 Tax=Lycorma delicatula TaxID=130591 RepID=UPI003F51229C
MASIDSGVDTGNDSNDSFAQDKNSVAQNEIQANTISSTIGNTDFIATDGKLKHCVVRCNGITPFHMDSSAAGLSFVHVQPVSLSRGYEISLQRLNTHYQRNRLINKLRARSLKEKLKHDHYKSWFDFTSSRDEDRLRLAAFMNDVAKVRQLLNAGVNPNCPDCQYRTPLHLSACNGYTEVVRLLLERGANPNFTDMVGNTPLHLAVCTNHIAVVTLLLKAVFHTWEKIQHKSSIVCCNENFIFNSYNSDLLMNKIIIFYLSKMFLKEGTDASCYNVTGRSPLQLAQSKLKIIQRSQDSEYRHQVTSQVIEMLLAFIKKKTEVTKNAVDEELLNAFQSRLQVSETQEQVESELKNLLDNLSTLSLSNSSDATSTAATSSPSI